MKRKRLTAGAVLVAMAGLSGCSPETSAQWGRWGLPVAASDRAPHIGSLWSGAWIASIIIGLLVWGLIGFAVVRYRRTHASQVPRQTQYNVPMEIMYTIVPFLIIGVLFVYTVRAQDAVLDHSGAPEHRVRVVGQKWSWTFNYMEDQNPAVGAVVHEAGTIEKIPDLVLPVNESVEFTLQSADVIHSFWVPEFYFKLDVIPGKVNTFELTPTREGTYFGKCAELCGTYHSAMLFTVRVVSVDEYESYLRTLKDAGQVGEIKPPASVAQLPVPAAVEETPR